MNPNEYQEQARFDQWVAHCPWVGAVLSVYPDDVSWYCEHRPARHTGWRFVAGDSPALAWAALLDNLGFDPTAPPEL